MDPGNFGHAYRPTDLAVFLVRLLLLFECNVPFGALQTPCLSPFENSLLSVEELILLVFLQTHLRLPIALKVVFREDRLPV
jgi:hypothetical protein